ncbi:hypothetical protein C2S51_004326 [Perilla frutescens var. frutescens]|nr:hypothetical protein C2S51_004326 [Perilla frutescens var. frutescens]
MGTVFLDRCLCACRLWDLTGIPYSHVICALNHAKQDPKAFISKWYHKSSYMASYEHVIEVMAGKLVKESDRFEKLEPLPTKTLPGRPPKRRIRASNEIRKKKKVETEFGKATRRLSKKGLVIDALFVILQDTIELNPRTRTHINVILNLGFPSERLVTQNDAIASQTLISNPDANVKYPIPNERELSQSTQTSRGLRSSGSRKITFIGDGSNSIAAGQLPFKPSGLKWNGKRSITTPQLENEREKKRATKGDTNKSWI